MDYRSSESAAVISSNTYIYENDYLSKLRTNIAKNCVKFYKTE